MPLLLHCCFSRVLCGQSSQLSRPSARLSPTLRNEGGSNGGTWVGNPAPVVDEETGVVHLVFTRNNTDVLAMNSTDRGDTWSAAKAITDQVLAPQWRSSRPS